MQDSYVGNIADFAKYALLRVLTGITTEGECLSLGVVWYYNGPGEPGPVQRWDYLCDPDKHQTCDEDLFERLQVFTNPEKRSISKVMDLGILGDAVPFCDDVSRGPRADWLGSALERTEESCIVLVDPDTGLAPPSQQGRNSPKHAYLHEVKPFVERRQTVVVYQSDWRRKKGDTRDHEMRRWRDELPNGLPLAAAPRIVGTAQCVFIVLAASEHVELIDGRLDEMLGTGWGRHFKLL